MLALLITYEGVRRLIDPPATEGGVVLVVALVGVVVNLAATWVLARANRQSLNIEGAYQHILTDLAAFVATAIAGAVILLTDFHRADGIASLIVAAIMLRAAYGLLRRRAASSSRRRRRASTRTRSAARWSRTPASSRSTTCTCGRSPPASRRCRPT